eukprot:Sspe_Gene.109380::Locus_89513_Transcript_1_1_Confidence_1.000_Length_851::g.109380::m.109380
MSASEDIIWLGEYPFYPHGAPQEDILKVFETNTAKVRDAIGGDTVHAFHRMGSCAIPRMPGTPVVDILVAVKHFPLTKEEIERMEAAGYQYKGNAPHNDHDQWFYGGEGKPGHLGRVVVHCVPHTDPFIEKMLSYVEYVKRSPEDFKRYADVKLRAALEASEKGAEGEKVSQYKGEKVVS